MKTRTIRVCSSCQWREYDGESVEECPDCGEEIREREEFTEALACGCLVSVCQCGCGTIALEYCALHRAADQLADKLKCSCKLILQLYDRYGAQIAADPGSRYRRTRQAQNALELLDRITKERQDANG